VTKTQKLHRERDPQVQRSFTAAVLVSALLVGGALGVVGLRVQQVHLAYQLDSLRAERRRLEQKVMRLRHDSLDPDLIDELARKELSFVEPLDVIILLDGRDASK
jgi:cell division protein FtsB